MTDVLNAEERSDDKPARKQRICCDFCQCELGADGGVLKTSDKAKKLEKADAEISRLKKDIEDLQGRLDTAKQELESLKAPKPDTGDPKVDRPKADHAPALKSFAY